MGFFNSENVRLLLHNKFVAVLGDSIQRSVYKDLVKLLQGDKFLSDNELRKKGEMSFANDTLVEGGSLGVMHNGPNYREVRQYRSGHHLVRFYFLTRAYSEYVESVLADFEAGPPPDVLILNSCIWDLIRYKDQPMECYKANLDHLFSRLTEVLSPECLVIWNMTMPVGFRPDEMPEYTKHNLRWDVIEGNFYSSTLANLHKMDVLDMHYHFRFDLHYRCRDFIHWNQLAHRKYSQILLAHIAQAWGVQPPDAPKVKSEPVPSDPPPVVVPMRNVPFPLPFPKYVPEVGPHGLGPPMPCVPSPVFPMRNFPNPFPQPFPPFNNQEFGQRFIGPEYLPGYTAFDTDDSQMIESFMRGPMGFPAQQMGPNGFSPFVSDSPLLFGNLPPRNGSFGGHGKVPVPMFNNHPFNAMPIPPYNLTMPEMEFGTFHYNPSWSGRQRLSKKKNMRPPQNPYHRPFPARN